MIIYRKFQDAQDEFYHERGTQPNCCLMHEVTWFYIMREIVVGFTEIGEGDLREEEDKFNMLDGIRTYFCNQIPEGKFYFGRNEL